MSLLAVAEETAHELPIPALGVGAIAFVGLLVLLAVTLVIGKGRPHS